MSSSVRPSCSLGVGEMNLGCGGAGVALADLGRGVAEGDKMFGTLLGVGSGEASFLINAGSGIGEGLGERGTMPRDLSAAVDV